MASKTMSAPAVPGSYWAQASPYGDVLPVPVRGAGSKIYDAEGREYIDYLLGSGPMILGHKHPAVLAALREQLERGTQFFYMTAEAMELAEEVVRAVPCAEALRFSVSGTEATHYALRFARAYTGREKVLKFEGGFHGAHDYVSMSHAPKKVSPYPRPIPDSGGIPDRIQDLVLIAPYNDLATTAQLIDEYGDDIAAVIVEPLQRYITPKPDFWHGLREITRRNGIVLIYDEIVTGFRLAYGGAQEYYGVIPDLAVLGKALGGGIALSGIAGPHDIIDLSDISNSGKENYVEQLGTFKGSPLAIVAGLATLKVLQQPGVYERLHAAGARLRSGLSEILSDYGAPYRVYGEGPTFKVVFIDHDVVTHRDGFDADAKLLSRFERALVQGGLNIRPGMRHYVSLAHTNEDIDRTLEIAANAARETLPR
ncbi:MAG TPA: aminotransferase class III-fold pyridoxal phosphate-dependent enzyme [Anaerolineae bacterium]|nr:aminotransferase class III-fold pyridoxal phosphate-dependent enzyme [Anaerolineae bacterium]